jgi:nucleotide-binding universal stress UspA family protein
MDVRSILVPYDFSADADVALERAIELAKVFGARLHLLHVFHQPVEVLSPYEIALPVTLIEEVREAAARRLAPVAQRARDAGVEVESQVREGSPSEQIEAEARSLGVDLVVMGTRGYTGLKHVLLGSVAERTVRHAPCPVLTVKALPAN